MSTYTNEAEQTSPLPDSPEPGGKKPGLPRPPFYANEYLDMAEILEFAFDRFGRLILAIMQYTVDETVPKDFPPDLKIMFSIYQKKIDFAREKYVRKCATNAENGAKGGKAKAENARRQATASAFKPPTLKQFQTIVKHYLNAGDIEKVDSRDVKAFFDRLKGANWIIGGEPIQQNSDLDVAILARFGAFPRITTRTTYYSVFEEIFSTLHAMRDDEGRSQADDTAYNFFDVYDESTKTWTVDGEEFKDVKSALTQFMKRYSDFSDT